jgi:hypothetical protein
MRPSCYRFRSAGLALLVILAALFASRGAFAQACCAGTTAVTPARLALHESALVGLQARAASVFGSFDPHAAYIAAPAGASEIDLEQDVFGAVRVLGRGQLALLVPFVETRRAARALSEMGGGVGDLNVSGRYDFTLAGTSRVVPGIALLVGLTLPTGRAPESATTPLQTSATGIGAFQANAGLALEQSFGPITLNLTGIAAKRAARTVHAAIDVHEALATQLSLLLAGAYSFPNDAALALVASLTTEGNPTIDGVEATGNARRSVRLTAAGLYPIDDHWKLTGNLFIDPPIAPLGRNSPVSTGIAATVVRAW